MGGGGMSDKLTAYSEETNGQMIYTKYKEEDIAFNPLSTNAIAIGEGAGGNSGTVEVLSRALRQPLLLLLVRMLVKIISKPSQLLLVHVQARIHKASQVWRWVLWQVIAVKEMMLLP
jgi:hypothetical protein